jgi:hypothetical protein
VKVHTGIQPPAIAAPSEALAFAILMCGAVPDGCWLISRLGVAG